MKLDRHGNLDLTGGDYELNGLWLLVPSLLGIGLIALAIIADVQWGWRDIWPAVFLEVGATLGLAAILFWLERRFVRSVRRSQVPICTLADPPAGIEQVTGFDGALRYRCAHDPKHVWSAFGVREK